MKQRFIRLTTNLTAIAIGACIFAIALLLAIALTLILTAAALADGCIGTVTSTADNGAVLRTKVDQTFSPATKTGRLLARGSTACAISKQTITDPNTRKTVTWYQIRGGDWVYQSVVSFVPAAPTSPTNDLATPSHTFTPTSLQTRPPGHTPTRIATNTPLPPVILTQTASQYAIEQCWIPPDAPATSPGVCSLYPFGSRFTQRVIQISP